MDIEIVMKRLYESEINCSISSFWDNGWDVKLGDEMNGFKAEGNFHTLDEAAAFLDREARKHCEESLYALGKVSTRGGRLFVWNRSAAGIPRTEAEGKFGGPERRRTHSRTYRPHAYRSTCP
jgi:hypothetical protein